MWAEPCKLREEMRSLISMRVRMERKHTPKTSWRKNSNGPGKSYVGVKKKTSESVSTQMKHGIIRREMVPKTKKGK